MQESIIKILKTNSRVKHVSHYCMVPDAQVRVAGNIQVITPKRTNCNLNFLINQFTHLIEKMVVCISGKLNLKHDRLGMTDNQVKVIRVELFDSIQLFYEIVDLFFMEFQEFQAKAVEVAEIMIET